MLCTLAHYPTPVRRLFRHAAKACKIDAEQYCNITWFFGYKSGQIIACLRWGWEWRGERAGAAA